MKKKLLIAFAIFTTFLMLIVAGYFSLPFFLKSTYFLHLVENKAHIKIDKIENYKISQTLSSIKISINTLEISSNKFNATAKHLQYNLKLINLISKKPTFGHLTIQNLSVSAHPMPKQAVPTKTIIKPLPLSITVNHLEATYEQYKIVGSLDLCLDLITKNNTFSFNGNINESPITLKAQINPTNLHLNLNVKKFSPKDFPIYLQAISNARANFDLELKNNLELESGSFKISKINYKGLKLENPSAQIKQNKLVINIPNIAYKNYIAGKNSTLILNTKNYTGRLMFGAIDIAKLAIQNPEIDFKYNKENQNYSLKGFGGGFLINTNGKLDLKHFENTTLEGFFETPFIDYKQIQPLLGAKLSQYIYSGELKAKKINFNGQIKDKESIVKTGELVAQHAKFIVEKGTYPFDITFANIKVTPEDVIIQGTGYSDKVNLIQSKLIIKRKKGYPAFMHLVLNGQATQNTQDFLYKALLSHEDAKYIDYAKDIRGPFSAVIDIKDYYWRSVPHFDFNVNIDSNLTLVDDKISKTPIRLIGNFAIQRKNNTLKVIANNLTLENNTSFINITGYLEHSREVLYNANLSGKINPQDIKNITYLKLSEKYLPTTNIVIKPSSIWGSLKKINFNADIEGKQLFKEQGFGVDEILAKGSYKNGLLSLNPVKLDGNLSISGLYNTKAKLFNGDIALNDFRLSKIKNLLNLPINEAILNGNVRLGVEGEKLQYIYSNNLTVSDLAYDGLTLKSAQIIFNKNQANIKNATALVLNNIVNFDGNINLKPLIININAKSQTFIVKKSESKTKSYIGNLSFKIPNAQIYANTHIDELIIEGSKPLLFNNVEAHVELAKKRYIKIQAPKTTIYIEMAKNTINVTAKDSYIFAHYIQSKTKKPSITTLNATFESPSKNDIDIKKLTGSLKLISENGNIKNFPDIYKILSLADILGLITGQIDMKKGFYYDKMVGVFDLNNGILKTTKPLIVKGTSNNLFVNGEVNLTNYHINALFMMTTFTFLNRIISSIPIIGHILGGKEKSFTGLSFRAQGYLDGKMSIYPVPWESLGKGVLGIIERTIELPAYLLGVNGNNKK